MHIKLWEAVHLKPGTKVKVDPDSHGHSELDRLTTYEIVDIDYVRRDVKPSELALSGMEGINIFLSDKSREFTGRRVYESIPHYLRRKDLYDDNTLITNVLLDVRDTQSRGSKSKRFGYAWFVRA